MDLLIRYQYEEVRINLITTIGTLLILLLYILYYSTQFKSVDNSHHVYEHQVNSFSS